MASFALDLTTIGHALNTLLEKEGIGGEGWEPVGTDQARLLEWYAAHRDDISKLDSLTAEASTAFEVLNDFLVAHGFEPKFDSSLDGIGVVSILDMLVEWAATCKTTVIDNYDWASGERNVYPAFRVPAEGVNVWNLAELDGSSHPLVELKTKTGHSLWLWVPDEGTEPASGLDLALMAQDLLQKQYQPDPWTDGVIVPMLEMSLDTELDWLVDMFTPTPHPGWQVQSANQQFKLRANEKGARVKVATSMGIEAVCVRPEPYVFRKPFLGFFTQPANPGLALAAFWADTDVWRNPEGTLEEL